MSSALFLTFCQNYFATPRMRTTKSQSSVKVRDSREPYALLWMRSSSGKTLPFSQLMSANTGTLFEAAGTAEVIGHYTGALSPARTFCDGAVTASGAVAAVRAEG